MIDIVKNQTCKLSYLQQAHEIELLASFALPSGLRSSITDRQIIQFRRELEAASEVSSAVRGRLLALSTQELRDLLE